MQQQEGQNNLYVWTVMEEGIEGKCENTYQVTEIPEYMVHDYEKGMFQPELCQGKKFWQVLRTRDITKCTDRSVFLSSKGHKNCVVGNCETENSKQTQTRYFACGLTAEDMQLHGMINEGEMRQNVVAFNTESVVTGTKQVLKLQKIQSVSSSMPEIPSPKICKDLSFEYPLTSEKITSRQEQRETISQLLKEARTKSLISEMNSDSSMYSQSKLDTEQLKTRIVEKLQEIASQLQSAEHFAEKEIPSQLKACVCQHCPQRLPGLLQDLLPRGGIRKDVHREEREDRQRVHPTPHARAEDRREVSYYTKKYLCIY